MSSTPIRALTGVVLAIGLVGCEVNPTTSSETAHSPRPSLLCWQGYCGEDPDPNPESVGVYVSQYVTDEACLDTQSSEDLDQDGITDYCELRLAQAFAPTLVYSQYDDIGQEPAFAVKSLGYHNGRLMALVMYMLSEYVDQGTEYCGVSAPSWLVCGHLGDSEAIVLRLRYEASTMHWVTDAAWFSQHEGYGIYCGGTAVWPYDYSTDGTKKSNEDVYSHGAEGACEYGSGSSYPSSLEYTGNAGGVPIVHVSISKHANYSTEDDCDGGNPQGILFFDVWSDQCSGDSSMTVDVPGTSRNVGASDHHEYFLDCREAALPALAQFHLQECYWSGNSNGKFGGWSDAMPESDPYADRLNGWVFGPW